MERNLSGWRPSPPDARDRKFFAPVGAADSLPTALDCSIPALPAPFEPALDQLQLGSCGPNMAAGDLIQSMLMKGVVNAPMPSRLFIYWCARFVMNTVDQDSGVYNRALYQALNKYGWCDETLWPYNIDRFREKPPQAAFDQAAGRKITEYLKVNQKLLDMKACLALGDAFGAGFTVYSSFMSAEVARTGDAPMPNLRSEQVRGGHDVLIVGYDDNAQRFKFKNSWGPGWGRNGYGTFPYAFLTDADFATDFWTVRGAGIAPPLPPPPPPNPGTLRVTFTADLIGGTYELVRVR